MAESMPTFVVVGHPNKGKSSVVAALAQDESVRIEPRSGTTTQSTAYRVEVDGHGVYRLVDTPGFQRPRRALAWLRERATTAAERPAAVRAFLEAHRESGEMVDECELLEPLMDGGLVVYVVDGSVPYGPEYEDEMEILRWTGRPGLGLINPIGDEARHLDSWKTALGQFLGVAVVFNPVAADFEQQMVVLDQFAAIAEANGVGVRRSLSLLKQARERAHDRASRVIAEWVSTALTERVEKLMAKDAIPTAQEPELRERYEQRMRELEEKARHEVERIYRHGRLERAGEGLTVPGEDLFDVDRWYLWGLTKRQLLTTLTTGGAGAGAAGGLVIDAGLGGASLAAGALIGGLVGGAAGLTAGLRYGDRMADMKLGPVTLAGRRVTYGPSKHPNLPFVVLGRALDHQGRVARWSHARREVMALDPESPEAIWAREGMEATRKKLVRCFSRIQRSRGDEGAIEGLYGVIRPLMNRTDSEH
ncbi:DUF3482 domain-containing protein [Mucisphaera calidilacus]|uniref:GTP-binding protein Der n=1 Tax=Mucisphaera calidilacus TaxID=2527982 RepID=A0A518BW47_9BACT|nr:DUF3482 domain-containing protein [Mucisphaera calidilacus]QDU71181.1 GTP-binding protein Der [Mucisphaera calidilacus]